MKSLILPVPILCLLAVLAAAGTTRAADRPNILWVTSEDNGPQLGCYGDDFADTPNLDALAAKSLRYLHCWSNAPVCAPARTTILTGSYPPRAGAEHMRSDIPLPPWVKSYPEILRAAGYYCINPGKTDYNYRGLDKKVWDKPVPVARLAELSDGGQPFMAVFNFTVSHESQIRKRPHEAVHDPAGVRVPAYHPDTPEVRQDWAQYYDKITEMDAQVGAKLAEFEEAGLLDDTIVFYYGDHGSGMPRSKRWPYDTGLHVPLIVHVPEKFRGLAPDDYAPGGTTARLVSFVDLAPTVLSLAGIETPATMHGHAFMGTHEAEPQPFLFGFRGRMDERIDLVRTVRNERFQYIRNYMPHRPWGQYVSYMFQTPTTQVWERLFREGTLDEAQARFWNPKPAEELYDLENDPDQVHNLAQTGEHAEVLGELRTAQRDWARRIRDTGFLPEGEMHARADGTTIYEMAGDPAKYDFETIFATAEAAADLDPRDAPELARLLEESPDPAVRYWAGSGLLMHGVQGARYGARAFSTALRDRNPHVRIVAGEALGRFGTPKDREEAVDQLLKDANLKVNGNDLYVAVYALNALDYCDELAVKARIEDIEKLPNQAEGYSGRLGSYIPRLIEKITADLRD